MFLFFKNKKICCAFLAFLIGVVFPASFVQALNSDDHDAKITLYRVSPADELGVYKYAYATSNSIKVQAAGSPLEAIGIFSYISPEGIPIELRYIADELGFHAVGRHLPRPPPIPDYIIRSLEYIRTHPNSENRGANRIW